MCGVCTRDWERQGGRWRYLSSEWREEPKKVGLTAARGKGHGKGTVL